MLKRVAAAALWFFAGWYVWAFAAYALGLMPLLGPVFGAALAIIFAGDPMHRIWSRRVSVDRVNRRLESLHVYPGS